ncbi:MAG: DUF1236 domain-containing protein [Rhodospirillales bacterium]|nr:DUF1236 domain-containing protein [Rhodospirillales bacterium]USO07513.1 MAG: DUF1236 domain-containing protein [Rhodospirillales bacterium]
MKTGVKLGALALAASTIIAFGATPAQADPHGYDHGRGNWHSDRHEWRGDYHFNDDSRYRGGSGFYYYDRAPMVVIGDSDRIIIGDYLKAHYRPQPRGFNRPYLVGAPLPRDVMYQPLPRNVLVRLRPVPSGYEYVRVDNDILLMAVATHKIVDAVAILSRL